MCTVNWGDAVCTADRPLACTGRNVPMNCVLKVTSSVISTNRSGTPRTATLPSTISRFLGRRLQLLGGDLEQLAPGLDRGLLHSPAEAVGRLTAGGHRAVRRDPCLAC